MADGMPCQTRLLFFVCIDVIHSCLFCFKFFRISHLLSLLDTSLPGRVFAVDAIVYKLKFALPVPHCTAHPRLFSLCVLF